MSRILIGLAGKAGVGKDTTAEMFWNRHAIHPYALADPIKSALSAMGFLRQEYDKDGAKDEIIPEIGVSYRRMAQKLGTEWGRDIHPEFWLKLAERFEYRMTHLKGMCISDIRFENEADWIRSRGGTMVHIDGPVRRPLAKDGQGHASEAGVERKLGDLIIYNTADLGFLGAQVDTIMEKIGG